MGFVYLIILLQFVWLVGSLLAGVITFCMAIFLVFQHDFKRVWKFLLATIGLIVPSIAFIHHYFGPFSNDQLSPFAVGISFVLIFTLGIGFIVRKRDE